MDHFEEKKKQSSRNESIESEPDFNTEKLVNAYKDYFLPEHWEIRGCKRRERVWYAADYLFG